MHETCKHQGNCKSSSSNKLNFDVHLSKKGLLCPYTRLPCLNFDGVNGSVCQTRGNQFAKPVRCCYLPFWVKDGRNIAILKGGVLHV